MKPRVTDTMIQELVEELRPQHRKLTGLLIRAELRRRHGHPGGVARIYRLLKQPQAPTTPSPIPRAAADEQKIAELQVTVEALRKELTEAVTRAEVAEHREQAHQDKWALKIHALREHIRRLGGDPYRRGG